MSADNEKSEDRSTSSSFRKVSGNIREEAGQRREALSLIRQMSARPFDDDSDESLNENNDREDEDDDDDDVQAPYPDGAYDPKEFEQIPAPSEIKELFQYITKYTPQHIELEYKLNPFMPDFIPAIGDIDAFIKIPRPDEVPTDIGLTVLDEPCTLQSDPAVLQLHLQAASKQSSSKRIIVKRVDNAVKNYKAIDKWVKDINNLYKSKPSSSLVYSKPMPDIDTLMQEWPTEFEEQLTTIELRKDINCDLFTYVDIVCALTDIPVYEFRIESLHLLFSLYTAINSLQIKADPATTDFKDNY
ncbi:intraflagellar transport protein 46 homolog [Planococcus citri]|uniref:intraflagellar transport protein 46 homolog n=1 Tax=Planococcus citri TaxID=170843 RepID=UPI0031F844C3